MRWERDFSSLELVRCGHGQIMLVCCHGRIFEYAICLHVCSVETSIGDHKTAYRMQVRLAASMRKMWD
jgi:hypothetical protein